MIFQTWNILPKEFKVWYLRHWVAKIKLKEFKYQSFWKMFFKKKFLMIKKEQFNNICPSTMEYCRARGCIFTKNFPCFILTKCLTPPERRKRPLGLTARDRKCFYYYWWISLGILKNLFPAKLRLDLLEWLCSLSSPGCSCIVQVRSRKSKGFGSKDW